MAKYPSFLFYYQDFLVGTSFMTLEEIGAYIKLLCFQADRGSLKEEDILKKIPAPIWHAICCKFQKDDNGFFNQRLREEMSKRYKFVESRRKNLHMEAHMGSHMVRAMDAHMDNDNDNKDSNSNRKEKKDKYLDFVLLTKEEYQKLIVKFGEDEAKERIERLNEYGHQKPKKFKEYGSHYHTILVWAKKDNTGVESNLTKAQKNNLAGLKRTMERIKKENNFDERGVSEGVSGIGGGLPRITIQ